MAGESVVVHPCSCIAGRLRVPGDKSVSHRVAILSALASGVSVIRGILMAEDCMNTVGALEALGARVAFEEGVLEMHGTGGGWREPGQVLNLGNSGTGMRLLAGLLAGSDMTVELSGDRSLRSRPMRRIKDPLDRMGAKVELLGQNGCAPIRITGGRLKGIEYEMPVASAQVKSCIMLASLFCTGRMRVRELMPTRDHTELLFQAAGIPLSLHGTWIEMDGFGPGGPRLAAREWFVPGDFSSAAFWLAAGAILSGARVAVEDVGLNPRRTVFMDALKRMGADVSVVPDAAASACPEPYGEISVKGGALEGIEVGGADIPGVIDELPLLAVVGAAARGRTVIRDAGELRVKESDRIACVAANLRLMGAVVEERDDGMAVEGGAAICGGVELDSYGDHRIAMAMAVLALRASGPVRINNVGCVRTSYPGFWRDMGRLGAHVELDRGN